MKNAATGIGLAVLGLGIAVNGLNLNGNTATATPAAFAPAGGPEEPTIVWYGLRDIDRTQAFGSQGGTNVVEYHAIYRAWSDGTIERRVARARINDDANCDDAMTDCVSNWFVISSPNEGLNAQADINFDERVDAADLGQLLAAWGDAPRNDYPPSDCPLGLIP